MLPYSLKVVWFVLSVLGLFSCWVTLLAFGRAVGAYWGPLCYCFGCTLMQVIFCIGLAWRMDPHLMPRKFCLAQTFIIGTATYILTGVASAFSAATSLAVLRSRVSGHEGQTVLRWRPAFLFPIVVYPAVATVIHVTLALKFDAIQPTDDLHCDSSRPEWVRFFGYAGMPFVLSAPCFLLSIKSLMVLYKTNQFLKGARSLEYSGSTF
ncbi:hypothetical protein AMATHDRAFT_125177, partial [Amanita thiersii Skay4041]